MEDVSAPLLPHQRDSRPCCVDNAIEAGVDDGLEVFAAYLLKGRDLSISGVVYQYVQAAKDLDRSLDCGLRRCLIA